MRELFRHVALTLFGALLIFGGAIVLALFPQMIDARYRLPAWLTYGMEFVSVGLFVFDSILILGASGIVTIKLLVFLGKERI